MIALKKIIAEKVLIRFDRTRLFEDEVTGSGINLTLLLHQNNDMKLKLEKKLRFLNIFRKLTKMIKDKDKIHKV